MLTTRGRSSLPGEAGKRDQGVGAPFFIINIEDRDNSSGGFLLNWVSTLNTSVHVCCLCVMVYSVITTHAYCLLNI